jgi:putative nucleotidyltransferase with HDIG domain
MKIVSAIGSLRRQIAIPSYFHAFVILVGGSLLVTLLLLPLPIGQVQLEAGDVASQNIVAPRRIVYESAMLTQQARERAAQAVPDYYDPPQSRIRRQQVGRSYEVLDLLTELRQDFSLTTSQRIDALLAIEDLKLTSTVSQQILDLSDNGWETVVAEVPLVLEQIMREDIKENSLSAARRRIPVLVSPELDEEASGVVNELVRVLVRPNSFLNPERTQELRQQAWDSVPVQTQTLEQGEIILRAGDIATAEDVEALDHLGLNQVDWSLWRFLQVLLLSAVLISLVVGTIYRLSPNLLKCRRQSSLFLLLSALGLVLARFMVVPHDWLPYLFPLAALTMLAALLLGIQASVALILPFALFVGYLSNGNVPLIFYVATGALLGSLVVGKAERLTAFLWAGMVVILSNLLMAVALWTQPLDATTTSQWFRILLVSVLNGGLSASIALIGYFVLGNLFGITTSLQLMELSRPTHPLLRQLLLKAPGTYHHTILVSNLAERAAEAIGADAFLIRVGAYYHDIGKIVRPYFFTENIADDSSPHDSLDAKTSAQIIISHVKDGIDLARKYHLPAVLHDFIYQHHGAQVMQYFYQKAANSAVDGETVDIADFRYPGPDPQSKETAILMMADICEAAVRAERPATRQDLENMVNRLVTDRVLDGSLVQSDLTFQEVQTIKRTFVQVLQGVHHPRIKYPTSQDVKPNEWVEVTVGSDRHLEGVIPQRIAPVNKEKSSEKLTPRNWEQGSTLPRPLVHDKSPVER